jgi:hypothetical protein
MVLSAVGECVNPEQIIMRKYLVYMLVATPAIAFAQQTPLENAIGARLMREISTGIQCEADHIKLQKRIEELEIALKNTMGSKPPETPKTVK